MTTAHFCNRSGQNIQLFYLSENGENVLVAELAAEERVSIDTVEGHVFAALDKSSGDILLLHTVGLYAFGDFDDNEKYVQCEDEDFQPLQRHYEGPSLECGFISKGFINLSNCKINVFYYNGSGEELLMQLNPWHTDIQTELVNTQFAERYHYEAIYLTHQFFARLPSGKLLQENKVAHIDIPSCNSDGSVDVSVDSSLTPIPSTTYSGFNITGQFSFPVVVRRENSNTSGKKSVDDETHHGQVGQQNTSTSTLDWTRRSNSSSFQSSSATGTRNSGISPDCYIPPNN